MKNLLLLIITVFASVISKAQVRTISLQASGLTCSMCSNAINKSLRTLDFVKDVEADIKTYTFQISFKPGTTIDFDKIKNKVESAGFAVCSFVATINFDNVRVIANQPAVIGNNKFVFQQINEQVLNGEKKIRILDKGFVSAKEFRKNTIVVPSPFTYHVSL